MQIQWIWTSCGAFSLLYHHRRSWIYLTHSELRSSHSSAHSRFSTPTTCHLDAQLKNTNRGGWHKEEFLLTKEILSFHKRQHLRRRWFLCKLALSPVIGERQAEESALELFRGCKCSCFAVVYCRQYPSSASITSQSCLNNPCNSIVLFRGVSIETI